MRDRWLGGVAVCVLGAVLTLTMPAHGQGITDMKKGEGGSAVQGSAGPSGSADSASDLERCDKPMGTGWDVAYAALYLHSDEASFVTGVSLAVDGGEGVSWGS